MVGQRKLRRLSLLSYWLSPRECFLAIVGLNLDIADRSLYYWFSSLSEHQNYVKGLLKHKPDKVMRTNTGLGGEGYGNTFLVCVLNTVQLCSFLLGHFY